MIFSHTLPYSTRAAYHHESRYSVLKGMRWGVALLAWVVVEKLMGGSEWHLSALGAAMPASLLIAPMWAQLGRRVGMKSVAVGASLACSLLLLLAGLPLPLTAFTVLACGVMFTLGPTSVAETALYKANYPDSHRSRTVGLLRMSAFAGTGVAGLAAGWYLRDQPGSALLVFPLAGLIGLLGTVYLARIRVRGRNAPRTDRGSRLGLAEAAAVVRSDRRFVVYQVGYLLAGSAHFLSFPFLVKALNRELSADAVAIAIVLTLIPSLLQAATAPFWGRWLDRVTPIAARVIFSMMLACCYACFLVGALWQAYWLFCVGAALRGLALGGSTVVWATGSLYFAGSRDQAAAYTSVHASLTGLRGAVMPFVGAVLYLNIGSWTFGVSAALAGISSLLMIGCLVVEGRWPAMLAMPEAPTHQPGGGH